MSLQLTRIGAKPLVHSVHPAIESKLQNLIEELKLTGAEKHTVQHCIDELSHFSGFDNAAGSNEIADRMYQLMQMTMVQPSQNLLQRILGRKRLVKSMLAFVLGIMMIVSGFTMIVLPAPHDFEMFTLFYFNPNDGFTLMDLLSLMVVFGGVVMLLKIVKSK